MWFLGKERGITDGCLDGASGVIAIRPTLIGLHLSLSLVHTEVGATYCRAWCIK